MKIKYYGGSCFLFKSKKIKVLTNPKDEESKVKVSTLKPDIVVLTHEDNIQENSYYLIKTPGEFEVRDVFVYGYTSDVKTSNFEQADVYMFDIENIHLGIIDR